MRRTILLSFLALLTTVAAQQARAQRGGSGNGFAGGGHGFAGGARGFAAGGRGFAGHGHDFRGNRGGRDFDHDRDHRGFNSNFGWGGYPYGYGYGYAYLPPYDMGYDNNLIPDNSNDDAYQPQPPEYNQQASQPAPPPPPEKPVHPFVKEYNWPAPSAKAPSAPTSESEPPTFAIVLKNGSTISATMVLASANSLHYVDADGKLQHVNIAEVDRAATLKLDRSRNLNIFLPAAE